MLKKPRIAESVRNAPSVKAQARQAKDAASSQYGNGSQSPDESGDTAQDQGQEYAEDTRDEMAGRDGTRARPFGIKIYLFRTGGCHRIGHSPDA